MIQPNVDVSFVNQMFSYLNVNIVLFDNSRELQSNQTTDQRSTLQVLAGIIIQMKILVRKVWSQHFP